MKRPLLIVFFCAVGLPLIASPVLVSFRAEASDGNLVGISSDERISDALVSRGAGLVPRVDFEGYYDSQNWSTNAIFEGVGNNDAYLSLSFSIDPWHEWVPESISLSYQDAGSNQSARRLQLHYSGDNFGEVLFVDTSISGFPSPNDVNTVDLSELAPLSGIVEFRLYGFGAISSNGVLGLANDAALAVDGSPRALRISGELVAIPEPSAWLLIPAFLGALVMLIRIRRCQ